MGSIYDQDYDPAVDSFKVPPGLPPQDPTRPLEQQGLVSKFHVTQLVQPGETPHPPGTEYLVLRLGSDDLATRAALAAYAMAIVGTHPTLHADLTAKGNLARDVRDLANLIRNAEAYRHLRTALGHVEDGSSQAVSICQDDATGDWGLRCGLGEFLQRRQFSSATLHGALAQAGEFYKEN